MRVSGTPIRALYRAVLLETILPLVTATLVAAGVGLLLAYPVARARVKKPQVSNRLPTHSAAASVQPRRQPHPQ